MSFTSEEVQKTLSDAINSMELQYNQEKKKYKERIAELERNLKEKDQKLNELKDLFTSTKKKKEEGYKQMIENLNHDKEDLQKELENKLNEFKSALINKSTMENQIEFQKQSIMELELAKKKLSEEKEKVKNDLEKNIENLKNQFFLAQKQVDGFNDKEKEYKNEINKRDKNIEELKKHINELNDKINKQDDEYKNMLKLVKEHEEKLKKEKEELNNEREKYNALNQELIKKKNEEKQKKSEIEKLMKVNEVQKDKNESEEKLETKTYISTEEQEKIISDLLCELLLKLNNLQYFISLFDLLDKSLKQYDELKYIINLNSTSHESMNDILYNFYESLYSYFSVQQESATLNDFLLQKTFRLTDITKEDVEIVKKINSIKFSSNISILDSYRKKRELFFKSIDLTFNVLKDKMLGEKQKPTNNNIVPLNQNEFLKITKPPLELEINFDEILKVDYILVKYQVNNIFGKLRELTIHISEMPIFLIYSLIVNCHNLNNIKLIFLKDESEEKNKKNIEKLNDICPIILNNLKKLNSFSLINLPLISSKLSKFEVSLKISKIKKLALSNCFQKKEDVTSIIPFLSQNTLSEIDLSSHNFNIPSSLSNTFLNYNLNKQLVSMNFNNCKLNDDDIKSITNYIVSSTSLLLCDIGKNILSPKSCSTFGYCILKTTSLETLRINDCGINGESLLFIFNGKGSKPLKNVNLNGNEFGDIGLVSISAFMKNSPSLESIELERCGGSDMGFISLANMIQGNTNSKIKYVNFHKNNVTQASLGILKKFNDVFTSRKVVFALDKIEGQGDSNEIDCAIFT